MVPLPRGEGHRARNFCFSFAVLWLCGRVVVIGLSFVFPSGASSLHARLLRRECKYFGAYDEVVVTYRGCRLRLQVLFHRLPCGVVGRALKYHKEVKGVGSVSHGRWCVGLIFFWLADRPLRGVCVLLRSIMARGNLSRVPINYVRCACRSGCLRCGSVAQYERQADGGSYQTFIHFYACYVDATGMAGGVKVGLVASRCLFVFRSLLYR